MSFFYNTIISWAVYFMFSSFRSVVPWKTCNNTWNTNSCTPIYTLDEMAEMNISIKDLDGNKTLGSSSSAAEFFM
uniref:Uncharacterized protein n=1 Tax=Romanomermis culicivorax TaxID=13658 RepID=A0A915HNX1_ROMCU